MIVYRNHDDSIRECPVLRPDGRWTFRSWRRYPVGGWAESSVDFEKGWATEVEAIEMIRDLHLGHDEPPANGWIGYQRVLADSIEVVSPTDGWPEAEHWQAPEGAPEIEVGQIWERRGRAAVVECYEPHPITGILAVFVRYAHANPGIGSSIYRRPAAFWYSEERFRKLYKVPKDEGPKVED